MTQRVLASALMAVLVAACSGDGRITEPTVASVPLVMHAIGADPVTGATIETNKDDYVPGEVVHVVGRGWAGGETVHLFMTEEPDTHGDVSMDVVADGNGEFSVHFYDVQEHDLGVTFTLTATGATSGSQAVATFYDNLPIASATLDGGSAVTVAIGASIAVVVSGNVNTGGGDNTLGSIGLHVYLDGASPATATLLYCHDVTPDVVRSTPGNTPFTQSFSANAPGAAGVYDVIVSTYGSSTCTTPVQSLTLENAMTVEAVNQAPTADAGGPYTGNEGSAIDLDGTGSSDPDGTIAAYFWEYQVVSADAGTTCSFDDDTSGTPKITCTDDGTFTVKVTVKDNEGAQDEATANLQLNNVAPTVVIAPTSTTIDEGSSAGFTATITDPGANDIVASFLWTTTVGACTLQAGATATSATFSCNDNGSGNVKLDVTDDNGGVGSDAVSLTVNNVAPTVSITSPADFSVFAITDVPTLLNVAASFSDVGTADTHTCSVNWGAGAPVSGTVVEASGAGTCSALASPNPYTEAGIYTIVVTVTDDDGGVGSASLTVVVYDPSAGFVTGGGWLNVYAGSYRPDPSLSGKATFGFVSKYQRGASVPTGNTQFVFHAAGFNFHSSAYDWLVVNQGGTNAQFKGTGTVNGVGGYRFMLWATDNTPDTFRIKVWVDATGEVVFDNLYGQADDAQPQAIGGGSIQVHTGGNGKK